jgi:glyoxylase-like metal-dependent hydrolase (beta-lactamase superfamily II)
MMFSIGLGIWLFILPLAACTRAGQSSTHVGRLWLPVWSFKRWQSFPDLPAISREEVLMPNEIKTFLSASMGISANCYLLHFGGGYFLIDTGLAKGRAHLERDLRSSGCRPGDLKLVILTHGDLDHSGNSAYLREQYGAKIAMHRADLLNVESGDMFANKSVNPLARSIANSFFALTGMNRFDRFTPDVFLEDEQSLSSFGLDATILHLPGHSKGSIGVLTGDGNLFCGDLLENTHRPAVNSLGDDRPQMAASAEGLKGYPIKMVFPGHGKPFPWSQWIEGQCEESTNENH